MLFFFALLRIATSVISLMKVHAWCVCLTKFNFTIFYSVFYIFLWICVLNSFSSARRRHGRISLFKLLHVLFSSFFLLSPFSWLTCLLICVIPVNDSYIVIQLSPNFMITSRKEKAAYLLVFIRRKSDKFVKSEKYGVTDCRPFNYRKIIFITVNSNDWSE